MSNTILSIAVALTVMVQSCSAQKNTTTSQQVKTDSVSATVKTDSPQVQTVNPLAVVYADYNGIKNSLTKDNADSTAYFAKLLFKAVDKVDMNKFTAEQHTVWMKYMKDISYNAEHIKGVLELEHQREHFAKLSAAMIEVMKVIKPDFTVYIDHCPMYNNGKGADWLSTENKIVNPFYGSQMLGCGSVKQTITK